MKKKTTLAALLLTAVMVTPSYGVSPQFLDGVELYRNGQINTTNASFFVGYVTGVVHCDLCKMPDKATYGQIYDVVAKYIHDHPEETPQTYGASCSTSVLGRLAPPTKT